MSATRRNPGRWIALLAAAWLWLGVAGAARGQVKIELEPQDVGLMGVVRPGAWTPLRLTIDNQSPHPVAAICQWELSDADGEQVLAQRKVTLTQQRKQTVTLYASLPLRTDDKTIWRLQVIDAESNKSLAGRLIEGRQLIRILDPRERLVALTGPGPVGLGRYKKPYTAHERIDLVQGLKPALLPDRWYGLSAVQILVWTPDSGDPASPAIHPETHLALREWVRRGGHLVISLPIAGDMWSNSPLKDLVPPVRMVTLTDTWAPAWLGDGMPESMRHFDYKAFEIKPEAGNRVVVLRRDSEDRPVIVAWPYGLGRVTLIGVDLSDLRLAREGMPSGRYPIWSQILGWRGEVLPDERIDQMIRDRLMLEPSNRNYRLLDSQVIGPRIDMLEVAGAPLLIAVIFFGVYWLTAGPLGFAVLKRRGMVRHAWLGFTFVVLAASVIAWIGGYLMRPGDTRIQHLSVLTADAASGWTQTHSWLSLYAPTHGLYEVALDNSASEGQHNTLAAPGQNAAASVFIDAQRYTVDALSPDRINLPFRATAKQLEAGYLGRLPVAGTPGRAASGADARGDSGRASEGTTGGTSGGASGGASGGNSGGAAKPGEDAAAAQTGLWPLPKASFREEEHVPRGIATHHLPGELQEVIAVYCPADGREPIVTFKRFSWAPGEAATLDAQTHWERLVSAPADRYGIWGGMLGKHLQDATGSLPDIPGQPDKPRTDRGSQVRALDMLTFFDTLPPPKYAYKDANDALADLTRVSAFSRASTRQIDLTRSLLPGRLIFIGLLEDKEIPMPIKVDGRTVPSKGWTLVRWIVPVQ